MKKIKRVQEASHKYNSIKEFWQGFFYDSNDWRSWWKMLATDYFYLDRGNRYCRMRYGVFPDTLQIENDTIYSEIKETHVSAIYADRKGISIILKSGGYISIS